MNNSRSKLIYWIPRWIGILYILFLSLFTLDAFTAGAGFWNNILAFLVHMLPSIFVLIVLILAWRWPLAGGFLFFGLSISFLLFFKHYRFLNIAIIFEGPLLLTSILFFIGGIKEFKEHKQHEE